MRKLSLLAAVVVAVLFASCGEKGPLKGYKKAENGAYYKVITEVKEGRSPVLNDFLYLTVSYTSTSDSIPAFEKQPIVDVMRDPVFTGDIYAAYQMMKVGENKEFAIKADSFFIAMTGLSQQDLPAYITDQDYLYFNITLDSIKNNAQFQKEEIENLDKYIAENKIEQEPTESGLIFIELEKGTGDKITKGKKVSMHYTGTLIDGRVFDSSVQRGPLEFVFGETSFIPGFDEAVAMMNKGCKAKAIMPSNIAYGASNPNAPIPPFSTLIFDLEILNVE